MDIVALVAVFVVLLAIVTVVSAPLRAARRGAVAGEVAGEAELDVEALEAAREAKFREIREAELDMHTGKFSAGDHAALDATLRAEAVEILHALDAARERSES